MRDARGPVRILACGGDTFGGSPVRVGEVDGGNALARHFRCFLRASFLEFTLDEETSGGSIVSSGRQAYGAGFREEVLSAAYAAPKHDILHPV